MPAEAERALKSNDPLARFAGSVDSRTMDELREQVRLLRERD